MDVDCEAGQDILVRERNYRGCSLMFWHSAKGGIKQDPGYAKQLTFTVEMERGPGGKKLKIMCPKRVSSAIFQFLLLLAFLVVEDLNRQLYHRSRYPL